MLSYEIHNLQLKGELHVEVGGSRYASGAIWHSLNKSDWTIIGDSGTSGVSTTQPIDI